MTVGYLFCALEIVMNKSTNKRKDEKGFSCFIGQRWISILDPALDGKSILTSAMKLDSFVELLQE